MSHVKTTPYQAAAVYFKGAFPGTNVKQYLPEGTRGDAVG